MEGGMCYDDLTVPFKLHNKATKAFVMFSSTHKYQQVSEFAVVVLRLRQFQQLYDRYPRLCACHRTRLLSSVHKTEQH